MFGLFFNKCILSGFYILLIRIENGDDDGGDIVAVIIGFNVRWFVWAHFVGNLFGFPFLKNIAQKGEEAPDTMYTHSHTNVFVEKTSSRTS